MIRDALIVAVFYLVGSIPFSYIIARLVTGKDIRKLGSGNVGATNVMRTCGKAPGLLALILDTSKGAMAVGITLLLGADQRAAAIAGLAAIIGHSYPVFLRFQGGKSVATAAGAFLILAPFPILASISVFGVTVLIFRIVSLSSMVAAASFPLFALLFETGRGVVICGSLTACLILLRHHANIVRLFHRKEPSIGEEK